MSWGGGIGGFSSIFGGFVLFFMLSGSTSFKELNTIKIKDLTLPVLLNKNTTQKFLKSD